MEKVSFEKRPCPVIFVKKSILMEKQLLLKNILIELDQLPEAYLRHWYELIHTFRERLPVEEGGDIPPREAAFDWDTLVDEVMKSRRQSNRQRMGRVETLLNDQ